MKKAKQQQGMNLFEAVEQAAVHATFPPASDWDACVAFYRSLLVQYDAAMRAGDTEAALDTVERAEAFVSHLHGPMLSHNPRWSCWRDCADSLEKATAAPDGTVPTWGQSGSFVLDLAAPTRIEMDGMVCSFRVCSLLPSFSINVVEPLRNFYSETGYRSCHFNWPKAVAGVTLETAVRDCIAHYYKTEMRGKLVKLQERYVDRLLGRPEQKHYDSDFAGMKRPVLQRAAECDEENGGPEHCEDCGELYGECRCYDDEEEEMTVAA